MVHVYGLSDPERFTILQGRRTWRGADQEWYTDEWQRKAGCGPTCAAMLVSYLAHSQAPWRMLYPELSWERAPFLALMEEMWAHMTPGRMGINSIPPFTMGLQAFAADRGVDLPFRALDVPQLRLARPTVDQCAAFLRSALSADCPVAFLNLSAGEVPKLDSWHWVTIIALEEHSEGPLLCTVLDGGKEFTADFRLWFQTTRAGGGLVYVPNP